MLGTQHPLSGCLFGAADVWTNTCKPCMHDNEGFQGLHTCGCHLLCTLPTGQPSSHVCIPSAISTALLHRLDTEMTLAKPTYSRILAGTPESIKALCLNSHNHHGLPSLVTVYTGKRDLLFFSQSLLQWAPCQPVPPCTTLHPPPAVQSMTQLYMC